MTWTSHCFQEGVDFGSHTGIVILDITPQVGNFFEAFLNLEKGLNTPALYCPLFGDDSHQEWFETYWTGEMSAMFQKGDLNVPNMERLG